MFKGVLMFATNKQNSRSLSAMLIWPFVLLLFATGSVIGYIAFSNARHSINLVSGTLREEMASHIKVHLDKFLSIPQKINRLNADAIGGGTLAGASQQQIMTHFWEQVQIFDSVTSIYFGNNLGGLAAGGREGAAGGLYIISTTDFAKGTFNKFSTNSQGQPIGKPLAIPGFDSRTRPWYKAAEQRKTGTWSDIYILFTGTDMAIAPSRPVFDEDGTLLGVAATDIFLSHISTFLENLHTKRPGVSFIVERSGLLVASSTNTPLFTLGDGDRPQKRFSGQESSDPIISYSAAFLQNNFGDLKNIDGDHHLELQIDGEGYFLELFPFEDSDGLSWLITIVTPQSVFLEKIIDGNHLTATLILIAMLATGLLAIRISQWITKPIRRLNSSVKSIAVGDYTHRTDLQRGDEVGELATSFNAMAAQLEESFLQQKQMVEDLAKSNRELSESLKFSKTIIAESPIGITIYNESGDSIAANQAISELIGGELGRLFLQNYNTIDLWGKSGLLVAAKQAVKQNKKYRQEIAVVTGDRKKVMLDCQLVPFISGSERLLMVTYNDTTAWRNVEDALRAEQLLMNATLHALNDTYFLFDPQQGKALRWNKQFNLESGYSNSEIANLRAPDDYYSPEDVQKATSFIQKVLAGDTGVLELQLIRKDKTKVPYEYSVSAVETPDGPLLISIGRNVSDRKQLESRLRQSQKMEAIGTLAGGIAHDFNNILGSILGYNELAAEKVATDEVARHYLRQVNIAGLRAKDLVTQLLTFSRQSDHQIRPLEITSLVKESLQLIRSTTPTNIEIMIDIKINDCFIKADATGIHQIIMNLCSNATASMHETGGSLAIELDTVILDAGQGEINHVSAGNYALLAVSDTGPGIEAESLGRIFDPFFTTKDVGEGTGLGLSVVHGVVHKHGGFIKVATKINAGTTFKVYLPAIAKKFKVNDLANSSKPTVPEVVKGTILIVDDEPALVELGVAQLESFGCHVLATSDPKEAWRIFQSSPDKIDVVITDQAMPKITGIDLAKKMLALRPEIIIFLCTGYSRSVTPEKAKKIGIKEMLIKPVSMHDLANLLKQYLG